MPSLHPEIERAARTALATYSNVHRGSGHHALASTRLYERAKEVVLEYLELDRDRHAVIFCSPRRATRLAERLAPGTYEIVSSHDLGLPLGVRAVAIRRNALPRGTFETGGGTARLTGRDWVLWARGEARFEAGTPPIINAIAFAKALQLRGNGNAASLEGDMTSTQEPEDADSLGGCSGRELLERLRGSLIGSGQVPTATGPRRYIDLDNAASTKTFAPIWHAVRRAWRLPPAQRQSAIDHAKSTCARILSAPLSAYDVIFTSNATEAINLVATSLAAAEADCQPVVLTTYLEHNSNELPWRGVPGHHVVRLSTDAEGGIDLSQLETQLRAYNKEHAHGRKRITLLAVTGASNVLGVFPPLPEIAQLAQHYGARILVDAAQLVAHRRIDVAAFGIDYLAFSGHKVYAPFGTGVLIARKGLLSYTPAELAAISASGEENVGGIAALAESLQLLDRIGFDVIYEEEQALLRKILTGLGDLPRVRVLGTRDPSSPRLRQKAGIVVFDVKGALPGRVARELAERAGIGVRYGCHCAHLLVKRLVKVPPWAERLQYLMLTVAPGMSLPGVVRVSFGIQTTVQDVDAFLRAMDEIANRAPRVPFRRDMQAFIDEISRNVLAPSLYSAP